MPDLVELMNPPGPWDGAVAVIEAHDELLRLMHLAEDASLLANRLMAASGPARHRLNQAIAEARREHLNLHGIPMRLRLRRTQGDRRVIYRECQAIHTPYGLWVLWLDNKDVRLLHTIKTSRSVVYRLVDGDGVRWTVNKGGTRNG
jgi:hypothetical protein